MKRTIVGVAVAVGLAQLTAAPAHAAPKLDPVNALKAELGQGKAVNFRSTAKVTYGRGLSATSDVEGTIGFGPRGAAASDVAHTLRYSEDMLRQMRKQRPEETEALREGPIQAISTRGVSYVSGPLVDEALLSSGADWVRYRRADLPPSNLLLDVLDPATLKTLLSHRTSVRDGAVKGSVKPAKLAAVSSAFASRFGTRFGRRGTVSYTLRLGPTGLVERVSAKAVLPYADATVGVESDTRFAAWGREATVNLPLEGDVVDREQVADAVPARIPGIWY
ncbi:hypothetical protein ACWGH8_28605 [Nonomuraea muscovyensis]|uniref:Uncharacterized protein n=1 Tax=Nonomuraea muscovyensis TaxID=1124761 RepID=A0A7X0C4M1_9ACTN|nr:hypothetical protein [Nonomuraea muscovyensis]MBB6346634.1 hypothetical protein [Nonomuraea muscovyensis]